MCTILLRLDPTADEAVVLAANRDEFRGRPADPPGTIAPGVFAGRDQQAGGTWLAVGRRGLAAVTNVRDLPRRADARSRGVLPLAALDGTLPSRFDDFNAFNLLIVDRTGARVITHLGPGRTSAPVVLAAGTHAIVNEPFDTGDSPRRQRAEALVASAPPSFALLADHGPPADHGLCHHGETYGTVSSTVVVLDAAFRVGRYEHRPGLPCRTATDDLTLAARRTIGGDA